jgi:hypothetical protein
VISDILLLRVWAICDMRLDLNLFHDGAGGENLDWVGWRDAGEGYLYSWVVMEKVWDDERGKRGLIC